MDSTALRRHCHHAKVTIVEIPLEQLDWTGLVLCTPRDVIWSALPIWLEHRTGVLASWMWKQVEADEVYAAFTRELRKSGIKKDRLPRDLFTYQSAGAYGTKNAGPFGDKGAGLFAGWFRPCTVPSGAVDAMVDYFEEYWSQVREEAMVRFDDKATEAASFFFYSPPSTDYDDAELLTWGKGTPHHSAEVRAAYFHRTIARLTKLVAQGLPVKLSLHPLHLAKPPLAFLSWPSFLREDREWVDQVNSLKARLVCLSTWARFGSDVSFLVRGDQSYPHEYRPAVNVEFDIEQELSRYLTSLRLRCPLLFEEPNLSRWIASPAAAS